MIETPGKHEVYIRYTLCLRNRAFTLLHMSRTFIKDDELMPEAALWRAVLYDSITEARAIAARLVSEDPDTRKGAEDRRKSFLAQLDHAWIKHVCDLIDVHSGRYISGVKSILNANKRRNKTGISNTSNKTQRESIRSIADSA